MSQKASEAKSALKVWYCPPELIQRLNLGVIRMSRQMFRNALKRSIGADKDYADGCWIPFRNNPLGYLASRNPQAQAEELLRVINRLTPDFNAKE